MNFQLKAVVSLYWKIREMVLFKKEQTYVKIYRSCYKIM